MPMICSQREPIDLTISTRVSMHGQMMRRSIAVIKENVYESVAQGSLVRKEKKRTNRSELEIVKSQEKFGTKHQRPCALCEQSFSEVNLVLAVPFKACTASNTYIGITLDTTYISITRKTTAVYRRTGVNGLSVYY